MSDLRKTLTEWEDPIRSFRHSSYSPAALAEVKRLRNLTVSVCIPAHNEESTVGQVVSRIVKNLVVKHSLVDEIIVLDDRSTDHTAAVSAAAGARAVNTADVLPGIPGGPGKGETLWKSLHVSSGEILCWIDADIRAFRAEMISGLVGPLLMEPDIGFVKGFFTRPNIGERGGGRVTELVAKPLIASLFPDLVGVHQPLAGATAARRDVLEALPFQCGWGVEFALLLDVATSFGIQVIAQSDLGELRHRNKPLEKLIPQARAIMSVALSRSEISRSATRPLVSVVDGSASSTQRMMELPPMNELRYDDNGEVKKQSA